MVPIEFGINMRWRLILIGHKLKVSIGIGGRVIIVGRLKKAVTRCMVVLANIRITKYTVSILFLEVIAYILERIHFNQSSALSKRSVPQCDEEIRGKEEEHY